MSSIPHWFKLKIVWRILASSEISVFVDNFFNLFKLLSEKENFINNT